MPKLGYLFNGHFYHPLEFFPVPSQISLQWCQTDRFKPKPGTVLARQCQMSTAIYYQPRSHQMPNLPNQVLDGKIKFLFEGWFQINVKIKLKSLKITNEGKRQHSRAGDSWNKFFLSSSNFSVIHVKEIWTKYYLKLNHLHKQCLINESCLTW